MRVAICDDNQQDIERIRRYTLRMIDYAVEYAFYTRPEELLRECADAEQKPDMYILDIEMPGMDGLAVAKQIRETDPKALLVFLTSYTKYMPSVFEVVTFDFIPKPISEERLRVLFEKAGTYLNLTNQSFSFCYRRVRYSLKFDEILYLEKRGRQAIIHTKKMKYQSNMNLTCSFRIQRHGHAYGRHRAGSDKRIPEGADGKAHRICAGRNVTWHCMG